MLMRAPLSNSASALTSDIMRIKVIVCALVCAALAVAVCEMWRPLRGSELGAGNIRANISEGPVGLEVANSGLEERLPHEGDDHVGTRIVADALLFRVVGDGGNPLASVSAVLLKPLGRRSEVLESLGLSDATGVVQCSSYYLAQRGFIVGVEQSEADRRLFVRFSAPGYLSTDVAASHVRLGSIHTVAMRVGFRHVVRCSMVSGEALGDVEVGLSPVALPVLDAWGEEIGACGIGASGIHVGRTNRDGVVSFDGLEPGIYHVGVAPGRYGEGRRWISASGPPGARVTVPSGMTELIQDEAWAAALVIRGDSVVTMNGSTSNCLFEDGGMHHIARIESELSRAHDTPLVVVARKHGKSPEASWKVLLERSGWMECSVPLQPLDGFKVVVVDCSNRPESGSMGRVQILCSERESKVGWHLVQGKGIPEIDVAIQPGVAVRLPAGRYRLVPEDPVLARELDLADIKVDAGQDVVVQIPCSERLVLCYLSALDENGFPVVAPNLSVSEEGGARIKSRSLSGGNLHLFLPRKKIVLDCRDTRGVRVIWPVDLQAERASTVALEVKMVRQ